MKNYTDRVFVFREPPTGKDIADAVKLEDLHDWVLMEVTREYNETSHAMVVQTQKYRYEVRFRRVS